MSFLSPNIESAFASSVVSSLLTQALAQDLQTFGCQDAQALAKLTIEMLRNAGKEYPKAGQTLALEIYPNWCGQNVGQLYHEYNWRVERAGSAKLANPYLSGKTHIDIGGGPGTFVLELMKIKNDPTWEATIADIEDYRNLTAKQNSKIHFIKTTSDKIQNHQPFDTASMLYVLHHVEMDHKLFLQSWSKNIQKTLILFEDVKLNPDHPFPPRAYLPARPIEQKFLKLSLHDQQLFISGNDYICNHIASQALSMPVPGKYYEFEELQQFLTDVFPDATITAKYHGMYESKCYPGPEAMYIIEF